MSSTTSTPASATPNPPTFSYAQAAKGRTAAAVLSSQAPSGTSTPVKDASSVSDTPSASVNGTASSEAGDRSINGSFEEISRTDGPVEGATESTSKSSTLVDANSSPSSPSFGSASTTTLPKDEDISLAAAPAQSGTAWRGERRPQQTGGPDKNSDFQEVKRGRNSKGNKKREKAEIAEKEKAEVLEKEREPPKPEIPLVAAPLPAVNPWTVRMQSQAPKPKSTTQDAVDATPSADTSKASDVKKRSKGAAVENSTEKSTIASSPIQNTASGKVAKKIVDGKDETPNKRAGPRGNRVSEKEEKPATTQVPPPVEDATSWPTPETALGEEKRKVKGHVQEKDEKEDAGSSKPRQKKEWVPVPYTPSVTFNTPIPQRGGRGRGGGRGGRESTGRGNHASNGSISGEKSVSNHVGGTVNEKDKADSAARGASIPSNNSVKESSTDDSQVTRDQGKSVSAGEKQKVSGSKGDVSMFTDARLSINGGDSGKTTDSSKFRADQLVEGQLNPRGGSERRSEPNIRGMEQFRDGAASGRDSQPSRDRGDGRTDRGRGGYRGRGGFNNLPNGQQHPQHTFNGVHGAPQANGYAIRQNSPYSPPLQQQPFSNQFVPNPSRGRGGIRSQSIPNNSLYNSRFTNGNGTQMAPLQTGPSMYDFQPIPPMSAFPYNSYVDQYSVHTMVMMQLEYYFSIDNLCKDVFLRKHMDSQGFVSLEFIAKFKRVASLTSDLDVLRTAAQQSSVIDAVRGDDEKDWLRRKENWEQWVLPMVERDESRRVEGPRQHFRLVPGQRGPQVPGSHALSPPTFSPNGTESSFAPYGQPSAVPQMNGNDHFQPETPLSAAVPEFAPSLPLNGSVDPLDVETSFTDEQVYDLILVYHSPTKGEPTDTEAKLRAFQFASSRTYSNGSIDAKTLDDINNSRHGRGLSNGSSVNETSPSRLRHPGSPNTSHLGGHQVMWKKDTKAQVPLTDGAKEEPYHIARARALQARGTMASTFGVVQHDMKILYEFWAHFLRRNFNPTMYREFRQYAIEDATQRQAMDGINNLIAYYDETLKAKTLIPEVLAGHYVDLVNDSLLDTEGSAFDKLRAAWRNGALDLKSRKRVDHFVDAKLRERLEQ